MMKYSLILLLMMQFVHCRPPVSVKDHEAYNREKWVGAKRGGGELPKESSKRIKELPLDTDLVQESSTCFFKELQKTDQETEDRSDIAKVLQHCSGQHTRLSKLANEPAILNARNELKFGMNSRTCYGARCWFFQRFYIIAEYDDKFICDSHRDELGFGWDRRGVYKHFSENKEKKATCSWRENNHRNGRPVVRGVLNPSSSVTLEESKAILHYEGFLYHVGTPVCNAHKKYLQESTAQMLVEEKGFNLDPPPIGGLLSNSPRLEKQTITQASANSQEMRMSSQQEDEVTEQWVDVDQDVVDAFRAFATAAGETRLTSKSTFGELRHRTQEKKTCAARRLLDVIFQIAGKSDWRNFKCDVLTSSMSDIYTMKSSHKYAVVMETISERFLKAPTRREKELVIAVIAKRMPLQELRKFIPGLSERLYYKAKRIAAIGVAPEQEKFIRTRYNPAKLQYFMDFLISPEVMADLPFGSKKVTMSDGTKCTISNSLRLQRASEIIFMFTRIMTEKGLEKLMFSRSTMFKILSYCSATQRKASVCVDYFYGEAEQGFEDLERGIDFVLQNHGGSKGWKDATTAKMKEARFYLKGDFRLHTKNGSRVADHCWIHALSDPNDAQFSVQCDSPKLPNPHKHDLKCGRCEIVKEVLGDVRDAIVDLKKEVNGRKKSAADRRLLEEITDQLARVQEAEERIIDYKKHQLRSAFSYKVRENTVENLKPGEVLMTMDFGQKLLPTKFKEKQTEYFGKKGMTFHISHVVTKMEHDRLAQHQFVHIIKNDKQDTSAVTQIIRHVFQELKKVKINVVHLRSDNAGAYHSGATISSILAIAKTTGMTVASYSFSESQNEKSAADRVAGMVKNKIRAFVDAGKDAHTHEGFFLAASSGRLLDATSIYLTTVVDRPVSMNKIPRVSELGDFIYVKGGIQAWRHLYTGSGNFISSSSFIDTGNKGVLIVHKKAGHYPIRRGVTPALFWKLSPHSTPYMCAPGDGDDTHTPIHDNNHFYHCPESTCSASFAFIELLEDHILRGAHCAAPLKYSLRDNSLHMFSNGIEAVASNRLVIPEVDEAMDEATAPDQKEGAIVDKGYSLKVKKPSSRYSEKAKNFVEKLFDEGMNKGTKVPAEEAEIRMREAKNPDGSRMFPPEERLNSRQINAYYSRIKCVRANQSARQERRRMKRSDDGMDDFFDDEQEDYDDEEDYQECSILFDDIDEGYFDDEEFDSDGDLLMKSIMDNFDEIFDKDQGVEPTDEELSDPSPTIMIVEPVNVNLEDFIIL